MLVMNCGYEFSFASVFRCRELGLAGPEGLGRGTRLTLRLVDTFVQWTDE
jgi:hypothetical protein